MAASRKAGFVVAKEAIVITVGARPVEYQKADVLNKRTGQIDKDIPLTEFPPLDPGDEGVPYAFKAYQRVPKTHPAVEECPGAFLDLEDVDPELVVNG